MVKYDLPPLGAVQQPPSVCPKCGSHRTEIVGTSERGQLVLRCNACSERSVVSLHAAHHAPHEPTPADAIGVELDAMRTIAGALAALDDADARGRVLRWATERFGDARDPASSPEPPSAGSASGRDRPPSVDGIELRFEDTPEPVAAVPTGRAGIGSLLRGFVTDIRRLAFEWQET